MGSSINARLKFAFFSILALVIGAMFLYAWYSWLDGSKGIEDTSIAVDNVTGSLVLSYALLDPATDTASLFPALLELSSGETRNIEIDNEGNQLSGLQYAFSPNGEWAAFIDWSPRNLTSTNQTGWPNSLYRAQLSAVDRQGIVNDIVAVDTPVASSSFLAFPDISNNGEVLYMSSSLANSQAGDFFSHTTAEDWNIIMVDTEGNERILTQGQRPRWLDDDNFLFLKNLGVYHYSVKDDTETFVLPTLSPVMSLHDLKLDNEKRQVLILEPEAGAVRLFSLDFVDEKVVLAERDPIMAAVSSAVFSPDGHQIALVLVPPTFTTDTLVAIYDSEGNKIKDVSLPNASWAHTSLQAWLR